jgi:hypothetical protein
MQSNLSEKCVNDSQVLVTVKEASICLLTYGSLDVSHIWNSETILRLEFIPCLIQRAENCTSNHPLLSCCGGQYLSNNHSQHSILPPSRTVSTHLIRMHLRNPFHILYLNFVRQY